MASGLIQSPPDFDVAGGKPTYAVSTQDDCETRYSIHGKIVISSIVLLILVVLFVLLLCIYAKWFWRRSARLSRRRSASRDRQFYFINQEPARLRTLGLDSAVLQTLREQPVLESVRVEMVSATIPDSIPSRIRDNLSSEQGHTASCGEEYNGQNPTNIFCCHRQEQMNELEKDLGTSGGGGAIIMAQIGTEISRSPDGFSFPCEGPQLCSPNGSQSSSTSPVTLLRSVTRMVSRDRERIQVFPTDHLAECDVENNGPEQNQ